MGFVLGVWGYGGGNLFMQIVFNRDTALWRLLTELLLQLAALFLLQFFILIPYAARSCCTAASRITFFSAATFIVCTVDVETRTGGRKTIHTLCTTRPARRTRDICGSICSKVPTSSLSRAFFFFSPTLFLPLAISYKSSKSSETWVPNTETEGKRRDANGRPSVESSSVQLWCS